jgi:hypothetical protein
LCYYWVTPQSWTSIRYQSRFWYGLVHSVLADNAGAIIFHWYSWILTASYC